MTATSARFARTTIFMEGIPEANIVSCYACHGPNGEGVRDIPRLGGLAYFYVKARLEQWGQGYHSTPGSADAAGGEPSRAGGDRGAYLLSELVK